VPTVSVEGWPDLQVPADTLLLEACEAAELPVEAACGGFACCNTCRVEVLGDGHALTPMLPEEEPFLDGPRQRLACCARVRSDVRLRLAPGAL